MRMPLTIQMQVWMKRIWSFDVYRRVSDRRNSSELQLCNKLSTFFKIAGFAVPYIVLSKERNYFLLDLLIWESVLKIRMNHNDIRTNINTVLTFSLPIYLYIYLCTFLQISHALSNGKWISHKNEYSLNFELWTWNFQVNFKWMNCNLSVYHKMLK